MAVLPTGADTLVSGVTFEREPSLTWCIDQTAGRIKGTVDGLEAVRQAAEIILNTERFRWQIYQPYSGVELTALIGQDPGYVAAELQRRVREALAMDDRITGVSGFSYTINGDALRASMTVNSVYGDTELTVEVNVA